MTEPRVVRCTIEMDMVEGEQFNPYEKEVDDETAIKMAISSFVDLVQQAANGENGWTLDEDSWVQAKIVEDIS